MDRTYVTPRASVPDDLLLRRSTAQYATDHQQG